MNKEPHYLPTRTDICLGEYNVTDVTQNFHETYAECTEITIEHYGEEIIIGLYNKDIMSKVRGSYDYVDFRRKEKE
tara:strand:+ start:1332 stop:1559 length:228 start_codon:yes stop_codon:yes gene_type:complete